MSIADLIRVAVLLSIMLIVLGFAMLCSWRDATSLFRNPSLLLRSLLSMNVLLPLFAAIAVAVFSLRPVIEVVLIALSVSPVPPFLPLKQSKIAGHNEYIYGLLGASSLLNVVLAPLTVLILAMAFSRHATVPAAGIARIVALTVLVPFALGLLIHHLKPALADRAAPIASKAGIALLVLAVVPVFIKMWSPMMSLVGDGTLLALVAFVVVGLAVGHFLGGPDPANRSILALATATRHPGVALVIATQNFPDAKLVAPAVLLYLLVCTIASLPYVFWRKKHAAQ
jgi:bile acid:Na+ symporter, BASS family